LTDQIDFAQNDFDRLRLIRSDNIGPVSYIQLIKRYGSAARALKALPELAARGGGRAPRIADARSIQLEMDTAKKTGAHLLFLGDTDYPYLLKELTNPPPVLLWRGNLSLLQKPIIAMVGARNASAAACRFARDLANDLANSGISVASGLAKGIDTAAHQGSLNKAAIAVIAGGIDVYYPPENEGLQEEIAQRGLLLSEQPPGTEPRARHFPFRNRIIAGLARGTVVVEAAPRSGSLITARLAAEAGRQVMAIPGSPLDPRSRGCNTLIREGATLVQSAEDILEMIQHFDERAETANERYILLEPSDDKLREPSSEEIDKEVNDSERARVIDLLSITPVAVDELVRQSGFSAATIQLILLEFELAGRLTRHAGARVSLAD